MTLSILGLGFECKKHIIFRLLGVILATMPHGLVAFLACGVDMKHPTSFCESMNESDEDPMRIRDNEIQEGVSLLNSFINH